MLAVRYKYAVDQYSASLASQIAQYLSEAQISNKMHYGVRRYFKGNLVKVITRIRIPATTEASSGHSFQTVTNNQLPDNTKGR